MLRYRIITSEHYGCISQEGGPSPGVSVATKPGMFVAKQSILMREKKKKKKVKQRNFCFELICGFNIYSGDTAERTPASQHETTHGDFFNLTAPRVK